MPSGYSRASHSRHPSFIDISIFVINKRTLAVRIILWNMPRVDTHFQHFHKHLIIKRTPCRKNRFKEYATWIHTFSAFINISIFLIIKRTLCRKNHFKEYATWIHTFSAFINISIFLIIKRTLAARIIS